MAGTQPYPQELRERAVRMVAEVRPNYESDWAAITAAAARLGIGTAETLRKWVRQAQVDDGRRRRTRIPLVLAALDMGLWRRLGVLPRPAD